MYCVEPLYFSHVGYVPCGHCEGCKVAKKKEVSDRLQLEAKYHKYNYFVTLTYRPEIQPVSLVKKDLIDFNKRLAYRCGKMPQFYAVGEYGDESALAHYHLAIFADEDIFQNILDSWSFGRVGIDHLKIERCKYIAGYVAKKMNKPDDPRLHGRVPEFRMCSRRPALGFSFLYEMLERFVSDSDFKKIMLSHIFPPYSIFMGGKKVCIPRYVRDKLRPLYNEISDIQKDIYRRQKQEKDFAIFEAIENNVQRMLIEEGFENPDRLDIKSKLFDLRVDLNNRWKKVSKIKQKRGI